MFAFIQAHAKAIIAGIVVLDLLFGGHIIPPGETGFKLEKSNRSQDGGPRRLIVVSDGFIAYAWYRFWNARGAFGSADVLYVWPKGLRFSRSSRVAAHVAKLKQIHKGYDEIVFDALSMAANEIIETIAAFKGHPVQSKFRGVVLLDPAFDGKSVRGPGKIFKYPIRTGVIANVWLFFVPQLFVGFGKRNPHQRRSARTPLSLLTSQAGDVAGKGTRAEINIKLHFVIVRSPHERDKVLDGDYSVEAWRTKLKNSTGAEVLVLEVPDVDHASVDVHGPKWEQFVRRANEYAFTGTFPLP